MTPRWITPRLALFLVAAGLVALLLWSARSALAPFALGLVLAYLLAPAVARLHRAMPDRLRQQRFARPLAVLSVYAVVLVAVLGLAATALPPVLRQAQELAGQTPALTARTVARVDRLVDQYYVGAPESVRQTVDTIVGSQAVERLTSGAAEAIRRMAVAAIGALTGTVEWMLALIVVPIWLVYVLDDQERVMAGALALVPRDLRPDVEALRVIGDRILAAYIRGQLVVAVLLGLMVTVALMALGVPYFLLLGFLAGVLGVIPFLGAILGAVPAVAVAASQSLRLAALVALAFVAVQQIDNLFISPRVQARAVALNPALIMVVLVIGQTLMGPIGMLVAVPTTAILRDALHYLHVRLGDDRPGPLAALERVGYGAHATPLLLATRTPSGPDPSAAR